MSIETISIYESCIGNNPSICTPGIDETPLLEIEWNSLTHNFGDIITPQKKILESGLSYDSELKHDYILDINRDGFLDTVHAIGRFLIVDFDSDRKLDLVAEDTNLDGLIEPNEHNSYEYGPGDSKVFLLEDEEGNDLVRFRYYSEESDHQQRIGNVQFISPKFDEFFWDMGFKGDLDDDAFNELVALGPGRQIRVLDYDDFQEDEAKMFRARDLQNRDYPYDTVDGWADYWTESDLNSWWNIPWFQNVLNPIY
ncbi:hypothetical protein GF362_01250 [Candidatus Dojkabacteria bacterium]|nr:hypothetical protein [Candidatus Dojkabacteria bacterium]